MARRSILSDESVEDSLFGDAGVETTSARPAAEPAARSLDARYGRSRRLDVLAGGLFALVLLGIGAFVLINSNLTSPDAQLQVRDVAHTIIDDSHASLTFQIDSAPGTRVACEVQALDKNKGVIAYEVFEFPAINKNQRTVTQELVTLGRAATITAQACWTLSES